MSGSNNRLFIILAVALIGLICIGLLGLGAILFISGSNQAQDEVAVVPPTNTPFPPTFTPTSTSTPTPTQTPEPTSTPTMVVPIGGDIAAQSNGQPTEAPVVDVNATATNTRVLQTVTVTDLPEETPTPAPVVPNSGAVLTAATNGFLLWTGGGLLLVLLIYGGLSHFRSSAQLSGE